MTDNEFRALADSGAIRITDKERSWPASPKPSD